MAARAHNAPVQTRAITSRPHFHIRQPGSGGAGLGYSGGVSGGIVRNCSAQ